MGRTSVATLQARQGVVSERDAALTEMAPALRDKCTRMEQDMLNQAASNLRYYHAYGKDWADVRDNPDKYLTEAQRLQGVNPMTLLESVFAHRMDTMRKAMAFATRYSDADLNRLLDLRNTTHPDFRLHWGHVVHLVSVDGNVLRKQLEEQAVLSLWTPQELHTAIKKQYGGPRREGGHPLSIPKTVSAQLNQIVEVSRVWLRRRNEVWQGEEHSVYANVLNTAPDRFTPEMLQTLGTIQSRLSEVAQAAENDLALCQRTYAHVANVLGIPADGKGPPQIAEATVVAKEVVEEEPEPAKPAKPANKVLRNGHERNANGDELIPLNRPKPPKKKKKPARK